MEQKSSSHFAYILSVGLAMFSMFFGAGNVVYPLLIGQQASGATIWAFVGFFLTAVLVPFLGLYGLTLFDGDYRSFFSRIGSKAGFIVIALVMAFIGPLGALPRCIALSFATAQHMIPSLHLEGFCFFSVVLIYLSTFRKSRIVDIIGQWLSPLLVIALAVIIVMGLFDQPAVQEGVTVAATKSFSLGLVAGYQTMDLIGAFFFCAVVINSLKHVSITNGRLDKKLLTKNTLMASTIGAGLLGLVYFGMSFVAARHTALLANVPDAIVLSTITHHILGSYAGVVTSTAVILACLTTAIALAAVFAEFLHHDVSGNKLSYRWSLIITCVVSFFIATLEFSGIFKMLTPIVQVIYPSLIVLTVLNIANKLWGVKIIKAPVACAFILALISSI